MLKAVLALSCALFAATVCIPRNPIIGQAPAEHNEPQKKIPSFFNDEIFQRANSAIDYRTFIFTSPKSQLILWNIPEGKSITHTNTEHDSLYIVSEGNADITLDGTRTQANRHHLIVVPQGVSHAITNTSYVRPLKLISFLPPEYRKLPMQSE